MIYVLSVEPENFAFNTVKGSFATFASLAWAGFVSPEGKTLAA
jgi:hypothetical protein